MIAALTMRLRLLRWFLRRTFWNGIALFKAALNKPLVIPVPQDGNPKIEPVPMDQVVPGLKMPRVLAALQPDIPADERQPAKTLVYRVQTALYRLYPPTVAGLPPVNPDPQLNLRRAYGWLHRKLLPPPVMPAEYLGSADLGSLAVRGPYASYTQRRDDGLFEWDLQRLSHYEHHSGLRRIGCRVVFEIDPLRRGLRATRIVSELGDLTPADTRWEAAKQLALCAATTHLSLVRHFNWVHLAGGAMLAIATRNQLPGSHKLMRLLFPYIYGTQQSNDMVTRGQMLPGGDFESVFSFSFEGQCRLFDDTWGDFDIVHNDPPADAARRGVLGQGFDTPTEDNLAALFELMHDHARRYIALCWADDAALAADEHVGGWIDELNQRVPNGVGVDRTTLTRETLARLVARCLYLVSAQHEIQGSFLWNYQLWTHRQPVRVYANGQREPLDVYQRLVNANFNLCVHRRLLGDDFSHLAMDTEGAAEMRRFAWALALEQRRLQKQPWVAWRLYPAVLKVNINA